MQAILGYLGVFQAIVYSLLSHFHLTDFSPVADALVAALSAAFGGAGAVALHQSPPPAVKQQ